MSALLEESFESGPSRPVAAQAPLPVPSYTLRREVGGVDTEVVIQTFDDRILVIVTQSGKVGCLTQASLPDITPLLSGTAEAPTPSDSDSSPLALALPPPPVGIRLSPLLGAPPVPALHDLYVSQIATLVWWALQLGKAERRNVVVGLALKTLGEGVSEAERARFEGVMGMVAGWPGP